MYLRIALAVVLVAVAAFPPKGISGTAGCFRIMVSEYLIKNAPPMIVRIPIKGFKSLNEARERLNELARQSEQAEGGRFQLNAEELAYIRSIEQLYALNDEGLTKLYVNRIQATYRLLDTDLRLELARENLRQLKYEGADDFVEFVSRALAIVHGSVYSTNPSRIATTTEAVRYFTRKDLQALEKCFALEKKRPESDEKASNKLTNQQVAIIEKAGLNAQIIGELEPTSSKLVNCCRRGWCANCPLSLAFRKTDKDERALASLSDTELAQHLQETKDILEGRVSTPPTLFIYDYFIAKRQEK